MVEVEKGMPGEQVRRTAEDPAELIVKARSGDRVALGRLLETYRNYLRILARTQIGRVLEARLDASDLVQETFLEAHRDFQCFAGSGEREFLAWLRRILVRNLTDQARGQKRERRDARRQESLDEMLERSSTAVHEALAAGISSPSARASRREESVLLADALSSLPANYQDVMILRHLERLPFEEIAVRLGLSSGAVRMLWVRAVEKLRQFLAAAER